MSNRDKSIGALCLVILCVFGAKYVQNEALGLGVGPWFNALPDLVKLLMAGLAAAAVLAGISLKW